ncbi:MAG: aminotransferase class V-fold PLP-dependent enzyme [Actinomycetota bacterium]
MTDDPLGLDPETMRRLGYRAVDMLVDRLSDASIPPLRRATADEMAARLGGPPPEEPEDFDEILRRLSEDVLPFMSRGDHPGFFAFIPFAGTWPGALGDFVASAANVYAGSWMESAGPSQVELEVLGWFKEWVGYPSEAAGILLSGGSAANLTALACAREARAGWMSEDLVAYVSDQAHSSVARAARNLGFRPDQVRVLPVDDRYRLRTDLLASAIDADLSAGRKPLFVSASGGATNTGSVDSLPEIAAICRERGVWFHVDAAYGGFAVLAEAGREALAGLELADSITLDPHKWLYQPYECGCLLVRAGPALGAAFSITPDYLNDAVASAGEINFSDLGMQLSRSSRALKVWVSIRYFGVEAFRRAVERSIELAGLAKELVEQSPDLELLAPPSLGVVCFRRRFGGFHDEEALDTLNGQLVSALEASGLGLVSSTRLHGRYAIRMCVMSHTTGPADVERVVSFLESAEVSRELTSPIAAYERHPDITTSLRIPIPTRFTLLDELAPEDASRITALGAPREAVEGETIVEQWDSTREFFVIVDGSVDVTVDGERTASLGPGEFFGEIAALDWGAGFGYPRIARVVAATPLKLLVYPEGSLQQLVRELPVVERVIRAAVTHRLSVR